MVGLAFTALVAVAMAVRARTAIRAELGSRHVSGRALAKSERVCEELRLSNERLQRRNADLRAFQLAVVQGFDVIDEDAPAGAPEGARRGGRRRARSASRRRARRPHRGRVVRLERHRASRRPTALAADVSNCVRLRKESRPRAYAERFCGGGQLRKPPRLARLYGIHKRDIDSGVRAMYSATSMRSLPRRHERTCSGVSRQHVRRLVFALPAVQTEGGL